MCTPSAIGTVPSELKDRVQLTTHDFLTNQTVVAEAYYLRWIFHAFSDKYVVQTLQALVPALRKGARVIMNDGILPEPGTLGLSEERRIRTMDLFQQVTVNAREREAGDWEDLFKKADWRYRVLRA
jgi:hypothetical protein